ncbi:RNA polymerase II C-terminal domain kinase beta subunit [Recurvomyces mirabilis]|nr:RNA polymerase II C-terminal domain kinase beta subunit [Recurvomyces mirabilis]
MADPHPNTRLRVDWESMGICRYHMIGGKHNCTRDPCKWTHPEPEVVPLMWEREKARAASRERAEARGRLAERRAERESAEAGGVMDGVEERVDEDRGRLPLRYPYSPRMREDSRHGFRGRSPGRSPPRLNPANLSHKYATEADTYDREYEMRDAYVTRYRGQYPMPRTQTPPRGEYYERFQYGAHEDMAYPPARYGDHAPPGDLYDVVRYREEVYHPGYEGPYQRRHEEAYRGGGIYYPPHSFGDTATATQTRSAMLESRARAAEVAMPEAFMAPRSDVASMQTERIEEPASTIDMRSIGNINDPPKNANRQPLGRPNRLLPTPANSSPSYAEMLPAGARVIWRRAEAVPPADARGEMDIEAKSTTPKTSNFWAKRRAADAGVVQRAEEERRSEVGAKRSFSHSGAGAEEAGVSSRDRAELMPPPPPQATAKIINNTTLPFYIPPIPVKPRPYGLLHTKAEDMGATKRMSNGEAKPTGPHPSTIRVAPRFMSQAAIDKKLNPPNALDVQERSLAEAREDNIRLQGVTWLDNVRRALQLPIRTYTTACTYYHRFRLSHPHAVDYAWADAAAAALLMACKAEDTLKKTRDILAAAYNLKAGAHDPLTPDDVVFEAPSRIVIGLERLILESSGFDFRAKYPHNLMVKMCKTLENDEEELKKVGSIAWTVLTDLYRTFAPLKHTPATMALACLELATQLYAAATGDETFLKQIKAFDYEKAGSTRGEIMETLLDLLDLYTHHTANSILGTKYSLDDFLRIRLILNKECTDDSIPRFTSAPESTAINTVQAGETLSLANGHPTPVSPPQAGAPNAPQTLPAPQMPSLPDGGGTLRFMLDPRLVAEEKAEVKKFYTQEWEEVEEEIEIPIPQPPRSVVRSRSRDRHITETVTEIVIVTVSVQSGMVPLRIVLAGTTIATEARFLLEEQGRGVRGRI